MARVVHFEIPSDNPEKSIDFFSKVFGWKFNRWGEEQYWLAETGPNESPGINGAIIKKNGPDHPLVNTIGVENIDDTIKAVEDFGCEIVVPKMAVPGIGWLVYFKDPDKNITGVMQMDSNAK